jgi:hypothetical protein
MPAVTLRLNSADVGGQPIIWHASSRSTVMLPEFQLWTQWIIQGEDDVSHEVDELACTLELPTKEQGIRFWKAMRLPIEVRMGPVLAG